MSRKVIEINIPSDKNVSKFNERCNSLLNLGYQPSSNLNTFIERGTVHYYQQFFLYEDKVNIITKK